MVKLSWSIALASASLEKTVEDFIAKLLENRNVLLRKFSGAPHRAGLCFRVVWALSSGHYSKGRCGMLFSQIGQTVRHGLYTPRVTKGGRR